MQRGEAAKVCHVDQAFRDRFTADLAYEWLSRHGYEDEEINLLMSETTKIKHFAHADASLIGAKTHVAEGAAAGGAIGTAVGATAAAMAAVGTSLLIPGLGLAIAGPLVAALAGGGAGAVAGGAIGGLVGLGIPESNAHAYEVALREGGIVVGVVPHSPEEAIKIKDKFELLNGENIITA
jgi:hypothetical protein